MIKKILATTLLSLGMTAVYADAPVMINITGDMYNQPFSVDNKQWGYQFDNKTGKTFTFVLVVANAVAPVELQCWHGTKPVETFTVKQGETKQCVTDDVVRIVTSDGQDTPSIGSYTITVGSK